MRQDEKTELTHPQKDLAVKAKLSSLAVSAQSLAGQCLVSMPTIVDPQFRKKVILICSHNKSGAMGLILNQPNKELNFTKLCESLKLLDHTTEPRTDFSNLNIPILSGGPVEPGRGFVLYRSNGRASQAAPKSARVCEEVYLSAAVEFLKQIVHAQGPAQSLIIFGHADWKKGQLEQEMRDNAWLTYPGDAAFLFNTPQQTMYQAALKRIGVKLSALATVVGHA